MFHQIVVPSRRFQYQAQMAESVDALVSNTSGATRAGSTPALGTEKGEVLTPPFSVPRAGAEPVPFFSSPQRTRSLWSLGGPPGPLSPSGFAPIRFLAGGFSL